MLESLSFRFSLFILVLAVLILSCASKQPEIEFTAHAYNEIQYYWRHETLHLIVENQSDPEILSILHAGLNNGAYLQRNWSNIALFIIRDEPETRLRSLLAALESPDLLEAESARTLLRKYFISQYTPVYEQTLQGLGTGSTSQPEIPLLRKTDEEYTHILLENLSGSADIEIRILMIQLLMYFTHVPEVGVALMPLFDDDSPEIRGRICGVFSTIEEGSEYANDPDLRSKLLELLRDPVPYVRGSACRALSSQIKTDETIEILIEAASDEELTVRNVAYQSIARIDDPEEAIPVLLNAFNTESSWVLSNAVYYLGNIGPDASEALPKLIEFLDSDDTALVYNSIEAIGNIGITPEALQRILELVSHPVPAVRIEVAFALGKDGISNEIIEALNILAFDESFQVVAAACHSIGRVFPPEDAVPILMNRLDLGHYLASAYPINALGEIGPEAADALPALRELLNHEYEVMRSLAQEAIMKIEGTVEVESD